jgi:hypothetical protein
MTPMVEAGSLACTTGCGTSDFAVSHFFSRRSML